MYNGLTYIGSNKFSALYGLNDTIVDQKATGLQHLYVDDYQIDLIHTACSVVSVNDQAHFADRIKNKIGHAIKHQSHNSCVENHSVLVDLFIYDEFEKEDRVGVCEDYIRFQTIIKNTSKETKRFKLSSLVITQNGLNGNCSVNQNQLIFNIEDKILGVIANNTQKIYTSLDAPSGFMYHGIEDILYDKNLYLDEFYTTLPISASLNDYIDLKPGDSYTYDWAIVIGNHKDDLFKKLAAFEFKDYFNDVKSYWNSYLNQIHQVENYQSEVKTALVALKGALLNGFLPADLTGHYFANGKACFYVRDALMGSRAFLYAGLNDDFESIIRFLLTCEVKENGEFYQRYNSDKKADEGANNNVFSQIDSIGYFARVIHDYYQLTGNLACSYEQLRIVVNVLDDIETKYGLYGPEGGVNEGVYGPAYIISTNMFIAGGLKAAIEIAKVFGHEDDVSKWQAIYDALVKAIEGAFIDDTFYPYGYVSYHDEVIKKYDTPQLLAASLGYPLSNQYKKNFYTLLSVGTYFGYGFGYSEQEYHDGPWLFNTAGAAEVAYLIGDVENYKHIMEWMIKHQNDYGLCPEAIDARFEHQSFINPLMWANAEFVFAAYGQIIKKLRRPNNDH